MFLRLTSSRRRGSSNSSEISSSPRRPPVQRMVSSPSGVSCSKATAASRNSSSSARKRATVVTQVRRVAGQRPECHRPGPAQPVDHHRGLLPDAHRRGVQVGQRDHVRLLRRQRLGGQRGEPLRGDRDRQPRAAAGRTAARARRRGDSAGPDWQRAGQIGGDLLERAILQEPGEQQIPRLQQRQILGVLDLAGGYQPRRLEVQQCRGDHDELAGLLQVPGGYRPP